MTENKKENKGRECLQKMRSSKQERKDSFVSETKESELRRRKRKRNERGIEKETKRERVSQSMSEHGKEWAECYTGQAKGEVSGVRGMFSCVCVCFLLVCVFASFVVVC